MTQLVVGDRAQETCTTTGTGTLSLLGAVTQFQSFAAVGVSTGNTTSYTTEFTVADQSGVNWETSIGVYTTSGSTLTRTAVLSSSNAGALVNFGAGTKNVFITYSAVTSVSGGGGGTYPTIKPTLNLDFANSGTVDPRITFARATTATYYDGKTTAMAEQNLLLQSNTFSNAAWVATNGTVASGVTDPAGTTTAFSFTATGVATLYQTLTTTATPYTLSFYIQRLTGTGAVNLTLDGTTLTAQTITGSWARYSVTATPTGASHTIGLQLAVSGDVVNIFSSQLENRSSMTAANITTTVAITNYIPVLMTAPSGVPRLDYNPVTGQALGLLIEEQRTNLLTYSQDFSNAAWTKTGATIGVGVIAPDGSVSQKITSNQSTTISTVYRGITPAAGGLTFSGYVKSDGICNWVQIVISGSGVNTGIARVWVNLITGAVGTIIGGWSSVAITSVGNGWFRVSCITTVTATTGNYYFSNATGNGVDSYTGDGYSGVYIWGAQLEAGSFATSLIPTTSAQVTRNADQASLQGTNFSSWYNQSQGSLYCDWDLGNTYTAMGIFISDGTLNNAIMVVYNSTNININVAGSAVLNATYGAGIAGGSYKSIVSYSTTSGIAARNGITSAIATGNKTPIVNQLNLNSPSITGSIDGHIRKITYYPQALSSANLVALTS